MHMSLKVLIRLAAPALLGLIFSCEREPVFIGTLTPEDTLDPGDTLPGPGGHPCDPDTVYFAQQILPILMSNCAMSGCHDKTSHEEDVILDSYASVRNTGGIKLNDPKDSKLYKVLLITDPNDRMPPPPMAALPAAQADLILKWIQQGAQNLTCDGGCDTAQVAYAASVWPILDLHCKGCHSGTAPSGGIALSNYSEVKASADNGSLWGSISHLSGYVAMPYPEGSAKLSECKLRTVRLWIDAGAPNN